jgi:putative transposase
VLQIFKDVIRKRERKPKDKWHLDAPERRRSQMTIKINGEYFILWRAVDADGYELDVELMSNLVYGHISCTNQDLILQTP